MTTPESEVRAVIERYARAWLAGDLPAVLGCYHDEFKLHYAGSNALSGDHVGKQAALATMAAFSRRTQRHLLAIVATMAGPQRGAIIARERLGTGSSAAEVERVFVYAVREDRLSECWTYDANQLLIDGLVGPR